MAQAKPTTNITQADVDALDREYRNYIGELRRAWLRENNNPPRGGHVYEIDLEEQRRVAGVIRRWSEYITPVAEKWWQERGFGVVWPDDPFSPTMHVFPLGTEAA